MAWEDLTDEEKASYRADAWAAAAVSFAALCALGVWYFFVRTG